MAYENFTKFRLISYSNLSQLKFLSKPTQWFMKDTEEMIVLIKLTEIGQ